jgi:AAA+ ATPase superfamily predicted ATPase
MFIGREQEIAQLRQPNWRDKALLIGVYGRRRIGKTALIEHAFENERIWKFEGIEKADARTQRRMFLFQLSRLTNDPAIAAKWSTTHTWEEVFILLSEKLADQSIILFLDEFQWLASMRRRMVSAFKWAWDNHLSLHRNCKFILCGSISSFMVRNVLRSSGLYGRIDLEINLTQLSPAEAMGMLGPGRSKEEVIDTYMVFGGVPQYLLELDPGLSLVQNLANLAFKPNGYFTAEYQRLFISHFGEDHRYEKIVAALASKPTQLLGVLAQNAGIEKGGSFSKLIEDLSLAGFVERRRPLGVSPGTRESQIRLFDEFLHFHFAFSLRQQGATVGAVTDATALLTGPKFTQWQGYAFERLCAKHAQLIARALGFDGISYVHGPWHAPAENGGRVAIDLVFERADKVITACELKYVNTLDATALIDGFTRQIDTLRRHRPRYGTQKVLVLGKNTTVPDVVRKFFDKILFAEEVFLIECL